MCGRCDGRDGRKYKHHDKCSGRHDKYKHHDRCVDCGDLPNNTGGPNFNSQLERMDCRCCNIKKGLPDIVRNPYSNHYCQSQKQFCEYLDRSPTSYLTIQDPSKLVLTPNPAIGPLPPGQQITIPPVVPVEDQISLRSRNVLIIGGSTGNGQHVANRFYAEGANVIITSRFPECYERPYRILRLDIRYECEVKKLIKKVAKLFDGRIDILINCANIYNFGLLADYNGDDYLNTHEFGTVGYQRVVHYALPYMRHSDNTRVISFGSLAAYAPLFLGGPGYSSMKRFLESWNVQLQIDEMYQKATGLQQFGPTFVLVEPTGFPSAEAYNENYKPTCTSINDPTFSNPLMWFKALDAIIPLQPAAVMGEMIFRIAVAPQPTVRYLIDGEASAPNNEALITQLTLLSATDSLNFLADFQKDLVGQTPVDLGKQTLIAQACPPQ